MEAAEQLGALLAKRGGDIYATRAEETKSHFMSDVQPELIALGFIWYVAFLFSTTCHEAAHALAGSTGIMLFMSENRAHRYLDWLRGNSYAMVGLVVAVFGFQYVFEPIEGAAMYALLPRELLVPLVRTIFRL